MSEFKSVFHENNLENISSQKKLVDILSKITPSISLMSMPYDIQKVFEEGSVADFNEFKISLAKNIEKWLSISKTEKIQARILSAEEQILLNAAFSFEYYTDILTPDEMESTNKVLEMVKDELTQRGVIIATADNESVNEIPSIVATETKSEETVKEYSEDAEENVEMPEVLFEKFSCNPITDDERQLIKKNVLEKCTLNLSSENGQMEIIDFLNPLLKVDVLYESIGKRWQALKESSENYTIEFKKVIGESAVGVENIILNTTQNDISARTESLDEETLQKAWLALDYYSFVLKPQYSECICNLRDFLTSALLYSEKEELSLEESEEAVTIAELKEAFSQAIKNGEDAELIVRKIALKLLESDNFIFLYDRNNSEKYPFFDVDGKVYAFTTTEGAESYIEQNLGEFKHIVCVKEITKDNYEAFISDLQFIEIDKICLDAPDFGIVIPVDYICSISSKWTIESSNSFVRNRLIRKNQLVAQFNSFTSEEAKSIHRDIYAKSLNNLTSEAYTHLCNGVVFCLMHGPFVENVTFYTKSAYERVNKIVSSTSSPCDLDFIVEGDNRYSIVEDLPAIGVVDIRNSGMHTCIFTSKDTANQVRKEFKAYGSDDNIVVATFEEVLQLSENYNGIAVDMPLYAHSINKKSVDAITLQIKAQKS